MVRLFLSFALAGLIYELYWHLVSRWHGVPSRWLGRSRAEQRLREGWPGYVRLVIAWVLVLLVYALGAGSTAPVFGTAWWREAADAGVWGFLAAMAPTLAAAEQYFTRRLVRRPPAMGVFGGSSCVPARAS